ncbi:hypothetical protein [Rhizobium leguminosarum]|uniref:hypothetical protein n=1 Tax=Rhizobium leguminosarum TaxID=384 RepID=UPI001C94838E|nr:hypothetical protein [Rhizobium leguminosarum]MBY5369875.1 hypothetical protein [Rhizobium leguminosarum]
MVTRPFILIGQIDGFPVILHVDNRPPVSPCFVQALVELADAGLPVINKFALGFGVTSARPQQYSLEERFAHIIR